jgi:hypothetical protein
VARADPQELKDDGEEIMMTPKLCLAVVTNFVVVAVSAAAEPGAVPIPDAVTALGGCWRGVGEAVGKPVVVALSSKLILQDAMFTVDVESSAVADPKDRYSAHLIFGSANRQTDEHGVGIIGFWADSFGGAYTALGRGESRPDGFEITYQYPDDAFVNRWTRSGNRLWWSIVARDSKGAEKAFATYVLNKAPCAPATP